MDKENFGCYNKNYLMFWQMDERLNEKIKALLTSYLPDSWGQADQNNCEEAVHVDLVRDKTEVQNQLRLPVFIIKLKGYLLE